VSHAFDTTGSYTIRVIGRDKDGAAGPAALKTVTIAEANVDANGNLNIGGSDANDRIQITFGGGVQVRLNGRKLGTFSSATRIFVFGGDGNDTVTIASNVPLPVEVRGGDGNDYITGGAKADLIDGGPGNDRLHGGLGDDEILGGDDNDTISGGSGNDTLDGGDGNDTINGEIGNDIMRGGLGNDRLNAGNGHDVVHGNEGQDYLDGGAGDDILVGGDASDKLYGRAGKDMLLAGIDADSVFGGAGDDLLITDRTSIDDNLSQLALALAILRTQGSGANFSSFFNATTVTPRTPDTAYGETGNDRFLGADDDIIKDKKSGDIVTFFNP
jgi:Ca2+-binding RTX toxin-like protein